jgi:hypothetical protein
VCTCPMCSGVGLCEHGKSDRDATTTMRASLFLQDSPRATMSRSMPIAPSIAGGFMGDGHDAVDLDNQEAYGAGMVLDKMEK